MKTNLGVSIIICSHNSERIIEKTLRTLIKQKTSRRKNWEILLIIDNRSDDNTLKHKNIIRNTGCYISS